MYFLMRSFKRVFASEILRFAMGTFRFSYSIRSIESRNFPMRRTESGSSVSWEFGAGVWPPILIRVNEKEECTVQIFLLSRFRQQRLRTKGEGPTKDNCASFDTSDLMGNRRWGTEPGTQLIFISSSWWIMLDSRSHLLATCASRTILSCLGHQETPIVAAKKFPPVAGGWRGASWSSRWTFLEGN
jgi:hypothetical protein